MNFTTYDYICIVLGIIGIGFSIYAFKLSDWSIRKLFIIEEDE